MWWWWCDEDAASLRTTVLLTGAGFLSGEFSGSVFPFLVLSFPVRFFVFFSWIGSGGAQPSPSFLDPCLLPSVRRFSSSLGGFQGCVVVVLIGGFLFLGCLFYSLPELWRLL
ncbi:hypothetical protein QL285_076186 [Trifolium repens]|nr:hypothetical protein QL285_076186 [Trifolium repens]